MRLADGFVRPAATFRPAGQERAFAIATLVLALGLVLFGNGVSALPTALHDHWLTIMAKVALMAALVATLAVALGMPLRELGLSRDRMGWGMLAGAGLAAVLSLPIVLYFAFPVGVPGGRIEHSVVDEKGVVAFWTWMLVTLPISTALFEEVVFRGCLQGVAVRAYGVVAGIAVTSLAFVLWHGVINYRTMQGTNVADSATLLAGAHVASFAGLFVGGVIFGLLRHRTGSVAAPFAFHWLIVLAMNTTLYALA